MAVLLSPLCATYTASDRFENLKLVRRNLQLNGLLAHSENKATSSIKRKGAIQGRSLDEWKTSVEQEEVDWVLISAARQRSVALAHRLASVSPNRPAYDMTTTSLDSGYDLVLAVDCIYNEHLIQPLVDTIAHYCPAGGKTVVWIVVELRSADVVCGLQAIVMLLVDNLLSYLDFWMRG